MNKTILTAENYHSPEANNQYMSASQFKNFIECEEMALALLRGDYEREATSALLVGSYVDAYFSGELPLFQAHHPEIFTRAGELKAEYRQADYIIARIVRDARFMAALNGPKQVIMTGEIECVPVKIKVDCLLPDRTVDLKIMRDLDDVWIPDEGRVPFWQAWRYDIQGAIYREVRRQKDGGAAKPFGLAVATKEKPEPDIALLEFDDHTLDVALDEIRANIGYFQGVKSGVIAPTRCEKCAYCRSTKVLIGWAPIVLRDEQ